MLESVRVRVCQDTEGVGGEVRPHFMKVKYERENIRSQGKSIPVKDKIQLPLQLSQSGPVSHLADISMYEWPPNTELVFRSDTPHMKPWWNYSVGLS